MIGGFPEDKINMFEEAEPQSLVENQGLMQGGGRGGGLLIPYHQLSMMNRQLSGRGSHSQWNWGNPASSIAGGTNRQLSGPSPIGGIDCFGDPNCSQCNGGRGCELGSTCKDGKCERNEPLVDTSPPWLKMYV